MSRTRQAQTAQTSQSADKVVELAKRLLRHYVDERRFARELRRLEKQHGYSSQEFYDQWKSGQLADSEDHFDWQSYYKMHQSTLAGIQQMKQELYAVLVDQLPRRSEEPRVQVAAGSIR